MRRLDPYRVRGVQPSGRCLQLRYHCPMTGNEVRMSAGTVDMGEALRQKADIEYRLRNGMPPVPRRQEQTDENMPWDDFVEQ